MPVFVVSHREAILLCTGCCASSSSPPPPPPPPPPNPSYLILLEGKNSRSMQQVRNIKQKQKQTQQNKADERTKTSNTEIIIDYKTYEMTAILSLSVTAYCVLFSTSWTTAHNYTQFFVCLFVCRITLPY